MDLVIGGSGFIGCRVVEILRRRQRFVRVLDVAPFPRDEVFAPTEMVRGSILDPTVLQAAVHGCDTVYHLAANPRLWARNANIFDQVNRQGTLNVLNAVQASAAVRCLVYTSTESILAPRRSKGPITADIQTTLEDMIGPYCRSKFLAEKAVRSFAARGLPVVTVNPTMPIGPGDRNLTPPGMMIRNFLLKKISGYMDGTLNWVDVRDAAAGHVLAAQKGTPGRRYILCGENATLKDFFTRLAAHCGRRPPRWKVPYAVAVAFSCLEEMFGRWTGRPPLSSVAGVKLCRRSLAFDGTAARRDLPGYTIRPLDESLRDAVQWHRRQLAAEGIRV